MVKYFLYILRCQDLTLYTGITTDLDRRIKEHNLSTLGARYTCGRRPVKLIYCKQFASRSLAAREECRIKKLPRSKKIEMIKLQK